MCTSAFEASSNPSIIINPKGAHDRVTEIIDAIYKLQDNLSALQTTGSTAALWKSFESLCEIKLAVIRIELERTQHKPLPEEEWNSHEWKKECSEWQGRRSQRLLANARITRIEYESSRMHVRKWSNTSSKSASREPEQASSDVEASGSASKRRPRNEDLFEHENNTGLKSTTRSLPVNDSRRGYR
jgi:hypothetical protein